MIAMAAWCLAAVSTTAYAKMNVCLKLRSTTTTSSLKDAVTSTEWATARTMYLHLMSKVGVDVSNAAITDYAVYTREGCRSDVKRKGGRSRSLATIPNSSEEETISLASYTLSFQFKVVGNALDVHAVSASLRGVPPCRD